MLSDHFGIQARGGCVCAGPYGHRLLGITEGQSCAMRDAILHGDESGKPGWVRLSLHYAMDDATVEAILSGVRDLARDPGGAGHPARPARRHAGDRRPQSA